MAFSFGNSGSGGLGTSPVKQLLEIDTEAIEFHAIAKDAKVQLMPAWPSEHLPPPTSSLLAIASKRELLAAGGPSAVVIASTEAVRSAFSSDGPGDIKSFVPQLTLDLGIRISQVAFSSDESLLAISAEQGGGLAVYEVDSLLKGNTSTSFEVSTAQIPVRALIPNPGAETAALFAVINTNGQLMIADMKARQVSNPIKEGVSCVAWSTKGKQLVAGLGDGSAVQMTPTGEVVKQIAKPPGVESNRHLSAISWLDNFTFLVIHTASDASDPTSTFHIVVTDKAGNCEYQKLPEVVGTFGLERYPPSIFVQRLKEFPPNLKEVLMLASTASEDVGLITKSMKPLSSNVDASQITDTFTTTTMTNDSRRAALPMADDMKNSSPIGMALDLSSKTLVRKPLPSDEMDESPTPLPALFILNNVGVLAGWWFTYAESIRTGTSYPGLVNVTSSTPQQASGNTFGASNGSAFGSGIKPATTGFGFPTAPASTTSMFGQTNTLGSSQSAFGAPSMLNSSKPAFGSPSSLGGNAPAFGAPSALGAGSSGNTAFGATSGMGARASPWGGSSTQTGGSFFGKPSFGSATSPWAAAGTGNTSTGSTGSTFGQNSGSVPQGSMFGSSSQSTTESSKQTTSGGGFASFANTGGFGSSAKGPSIFASQTPSNNFGSSTESSSIFGSTPAATKTDNLFGSSSSGFNLGSAWKNDQASKPVSNPEPSGNSSLFGNDFGKILGDATEQPQQARSEERDMEDEVVETAENPNSADNHSATHESTTPVKTPAPAKFSTAPPAASGLFGTQAQQKTTPAVVQNSTPALSMSATPPIKTTPTSDLPLPPDTTSKTTFTPTTSSEASTDSALKPVSDTARSSSGPPDESAEQPPSVSSESTTTKTPTPAKSAKSIIPTTISSTTDSPPNLFTSKTKSDATPTDPISSPSMLSSPKPTSTPIKASDEISKSPSSQRERPGSVTTVEDAEDDDAEDEEEYGEDEFDDDDEEEDAEEDNEHEDDEEDEGSVIDVAREIGVGANFNASAKSSFGRQSSGLTDASWANIHAPRLQPSQSRKDILENVRFPPVQPDNERSPSPERRLTPGFLRADGSRSISAPNIPENSKITLPRPTKQGENTNASFEQKQRAERARLSNIAAQQKAQEEQSLEDDQDESIRKLLASDVETSRVLEPFLAHQDYTASISKTGVPGQIERIYRDINSMIDTVGLNSRSIQAFTMGNDEVSQNGRELGELRTAKGWLLGEIGELEKLQQELEATLHDARLRQVPEKMVALGGLQSKIKTLLRQKKEINAIAISQFENAAEDEQHRNLELDFEQQSQRQALRAKWKEFQDRLSETESAISMLKSKLTTLGAGSRNGAATKVPTVEAVEKTIRKMTKMAEEKSGDVDLLEAQMRKLNMHPGTPSTSRHGSPFMTPQSSIYNPRTSLRSEGIGGASPLRNTWRGSVNGLDHSVNSAMLNSIYGLPTHKNLGEYTDEDIQPFVRRDKRSKAVMGHLRDALVGKNGEKTVKIVKLVDSGSVYRT